MDDVLFAPRAPIVIALPPSVPILMAPISSPVPNDTSPPAVIISALFMPFHTLKSASVVFILT